MASEYTPAGRAVLEIRERRKGFDLDGHRQQPPARRIIGELEGPDGLMDILACGHVLEGDYDPDDGCPTADWRPCRECMSGVTLTPLGIRLLGDGHVEGPLDLDERHTLNFLVAEFAEDLTWLQVATGDGPWAWLCCLPGHRVPGRPLSLHPGGPGLANLRTRGWTRVGDTVLVTQRFFLDRQEVFDVSHQTVGGERCIDACHVDRGEAVRDAERRRTLTSTPHEVRLRVQ